MVTILDYGMGNLRSVYNAVEYLGHRATICSEPDQLSSAERIIVPGVGAFPKCANRLREKGFVEPLEKFAFQDQKPVLGICLGMQVMLESSEEGATDIQGLGWFKGRIIRLSPKELTLRVPQIGWNQVNWLTQNSLTKGLPEKSDFYFVHSYWANCIEKKEIFAECDYGGSTTAAIIKNNVVATQFHPEKSQQPGLKFLENFLKWKP